MSQQLPLLKAIAIFFDTPSLSALLGSVIPFLILDTIVVTLRFLTRIRLNQTLKIEDWLMTPSFVGIIGLSVIYYHGLNTKALGYRWTYPPPPGAEQDPNYVQMPVEASDDRIVLTRRVCMHIAQLSDRYSVIVARILVPRHLRSGERSH